jgi:DNA-directed RNA polymerase specialized sigma24 family protein
MEEMIKYLRAMVQLQLLEAQAIAEREGRAPKFELLLADAGFSNADVAQMLGKTAGAAAKAISRGRAARRSLADVADTQPEQVNEDQR